MNGGSMDTAPTASGEAKEKAGLRTRNAVRLPSGERMNTGLRSRFGRCLTVCHRHTAPGAAAETQAQPGKAGKRKKYRFRHEPKNKSGTHNKTPLHALVDMQRGLTFV